MVDIIEMILKPFGALNRLSELGIFLIIVGIALVVNFFFSKKNNDEMKALELKVSANKANKQEKDYYLAYRMDRFLLKTGKYFFFTGVVVFLFGLIIQGVEHVFSIKS